MSRAIFLIECLRREFNRLSLRRSRPSIPCLTAVTAVNTDANTPGQVRPIADIPPSRRSPESAEHREHA